MQRKPHTPEPLTAEEAQHSTHDLANAAQTRFRKYTVTQAPGVQSIRQDCAIHCPR